MNRYELSRYALGEQPTVPLTRAEYDDILEARRWVLEGLAIEELFDLLLGNYEEFERELLSIALNNATYFDAGTEWSASLDVIQLVARRLANLLTTTQGYCDQLPHAVSTLYGGQSAQLAEVRAYFRREHATTLGYRVCTELRRYIQHRGAAVHGFSADSRWVERAGGRLHLFTFAPEVSVTRLAEDPKVKPAVVAEMRQGARETMTGDLMHDLRPFVREYVSALGRVHLKVRALLADDLGARDTTVADAIARFLAVPDPSGDASPIGLAAMEVNEAGLLEGRVPTFVTNAPVERRMALARRNHLPTHFHEYAVTGEVLRSTT